LKVAESYNRNGAIVKINRITLKKFNIKEYVVNADGYMPQKENEEEVILVNEKFDRFPSEIIVEIIATHPKSP